MTLHLYFARQYLSLLLRVLAFAAMLVFVVSALDSTRRSGAGADAIRTALGVAATKTPEIVAEAMPVIVMLSAIWFCARIARSNEVVASRGAGASALRSLFMPAASAFLVGVLGLVLLNPAVASMVRKQEALRAGMEKPGARLVSVRASGLWLRQRNADGHAILHAAGALGDGTTLSDITMIEFDRAGDAVRTTVADRAHLFDDREWIFVGGKRWDIDRSVENPELSAEEFPIERRSASITREQILEGYPRAETISIWNLPRFVRAMDAAGFSSRSYRLHFQSELARPFLFVAMFIIGSAFILQSPRLGHAGRAAFATLVCGFGVHSLQTLVKSLGTSGELPILVSAWFLPIAALMLGLAALLYLEDG